MNLVYFYGQVEFIFGQVLTFVVKSFCQGSVASYQVTLATKSVLIFTPHLIEEVSDQDMRKRTRLVTLAYFAFVAMIDLVPEPQPFILLGVLTGRDEPT